MNINKSILKYITGKEASEEKEALDSWKAESEDNLAAIKNIMEMQQQVSSLSDYKEVDHQKAWANIEQKMQAPSASISIPYKVYKIAAAIIFIIIAAFVISNNLDGLFPGEKTIVFKGSGIQNFQLKDGSNIILAEGSLLTQTVLRNVDLEGSAYFDISKDPSNPFVVTTHHGKVTVLGTEFNIHTTGSKTQIYVSEGKVQVSYLDKLYILEAGQMISMSGNNILMSNPPAIKPSDWKNKILTFENKSLKYVLETVAIYYNRELDWQYTEKSDPCKLNTVFKDESIDEVMKELSIISGVNYELTDKKIIIKSFKC
jgi:transmembrane sensor